MVLQEDQSVSPVDNIAHVPPVTKYSCVGEMRYCPASQERQWRHILFTKLSRLIIDESLVY